MYQLFVVIRFHAEYKRFYDIHQIYDTDLEQIY